MIHVVAVITTKPGQRETVLSEFRAILPTVRAEEGCLEYGPAIDVPGHRDPFGPDVFVVIEKWTSTESLAAHAASPHMVAYGKRMGELGLVAGQAVHALDPC